MLATMAFLESIVSECDESSQIHELDKNKSEAVEWLVCRTGAVQGVRVGDERSDQEQSRNQTSNGVIFGKSEYTKALAYTGMRRQTASGYQALASIAAQAVVEPASRVSKRCARERNG
jgi:hypothetical protein